MNEEAERMRRNVDEPRLTEEQRKYWADRAVQDVDALRNLKGMLHGVCLIVGNGPSQLDIPVDWMNSHVSFGVNYCHHREGFRPDYFVVGDCSVGVNEWPEAYARHRSIPMFLPSPGMDSFGTERAEVYRYKRVKRHGQPVGPVSDPTVGIAFTSVAHAVTLLAIFLGFTELLYVGLDGGDNMEHFYGRSREEDKNYFGIGLVEQWDKGFALLRQRFPSIEMINLSTQTTLKSLPKDNWRRH